MAHYKLWTLGDLKGGIDRFYSENGRFPTVNDIDNIDYLPSSRWIQMKFGGIVKVREALGYKDKHLGAGSFRTEIAKRINRSGLDFEHEIEKFLINKFGEPFVHTQKRVGNERNRLDFYVYSATKNFGVDVTFVNGSFRNLQTNINVKVAKYRSLGLEVFIVVKGDFSQERIDDWTLKKTIPLPSNWRVITSSDFISEVDKFQPFTIAK